MLFDQQRGHFAVTGFSHEREQRGLFKHEMALDVLLERALELNQHARQRGVVALSGAKSVFDPAQPS